MSHRHCVWGGGGQPRRHFGGQTRLTARRLGLNPVSKSRSVLSEQVSHKNENHAEGPGGRNLCQQRDGDGDPDAGRRGASADSGEGAMSSPQRREKHMDATHKVKVPAGPWEPAPPVLDSLRQNPLYSFLSKSRCKKDSLQKECHSFKQTATQSWSTHMCHVPITFPVS